MRVAVLGLGSAGRRHAANLATLGCEVVGFDPGTSRVPEGAAPAASEEDAIASAEAVVVASPTSLHAAQARRALDGGRPVLVEKPLAVRPSEAVGVVETAARTGLACSVAMNLRFHPGILELRRLLEARELGEVRFARASFGYDLRRWRPESDYRQSYSARAALGGGIVLDAIHELDYLLWLLGPAESVSGCTARLSGLEIDVEDTTVAAIRFRSGALAAVDLNFIEPVYRRCCLLVGSDATARWDWNEGAIEVRDRDGQERRIETPCEVEETYVEVLRDFLEALDGGNPPRTRAEEGLAAVRLADALKRSAGEGVTIRLS